MPRSRNSRSSSPKKNVSPDSQLEAQRKKIFETVKDIFIQTIDERVIQLVLEECDWKDEDAIEKLLVIGQSSEEQKKYKSKLHKIAEGVFGPLHSQLSESEKVIRRPNKTTSDDRSKAYYPSGEQYLQRTTSPARSGTDREPATVEVSDLHFPRLPSKLTTNNSSGTSSVHSQRSYNDLVKQPTVTSKGGLLTQAQSAYNQQFDDAECAQRWEKYKQTYSEQYVGTLRIQQTSGPTTDEQTPQGATIQSPVFTDDPAILQAEVAKPRSESGRSFPVRLLSNSSEEAAGADLLSQNLAKKAKVLLSNEKVQRLNSADLDETVLKCIYEVHDELLDESELARKVGAERNEETTDTDASQSAALNLLNQPMTLPTIGLSPEAAEFVPRPKPAAESKTTKVEETVTGPASKVSRSNSIEIKTGVRNTKRQSPTVMVGSPLDMASPLTASPSISPGISPPISRINNNSPAANLTGSPMFITPKWPPPLYHSMTRPPPMQPPILTHAGPRYVAGPPNPTHLPPPGAPGFGFPAYSSRMVYPVAPPPTFHMAGMHQQYVQQPPTQNTIEEQAAIATGQPIMATSESSRLISPSGVGSVKFVNPALDQKLGKIHAHHQSGRKVLVILRGLPGSGKSVLARSLQMTGVVLSTDDYFMKGPRYEYNPDKLTEAHQWNRERAKEAMKIGKSPVIIDNTNTQKWEFKPYVSMGNNFKYQVEIMEPDTQWKFKPNELAKRTLHNVPKDQIQRMLNRYEHNITVDMVTSKKKVDTKLKEEPVDCTVKDEAAGETITTVSNDEPGTFISIDIQKDGQGTRNRVSSFENLNRKDVNRLHSLYRGEDLKISKQRSAESDSDSLSTENLSFHSEPWSNTSSRNASPKTLRPSLKTPGVLQKIEAPKQVTVRQQSVKPFVKKVKRKAMKQIEAKLSAETLSIVDEIISEHARDKVLSVEDVNKLEDEVKALLTIYLSNESEITAAEELIGLKLHDLINKSFDVDESVTQEKSEEESEEDSDKENQPEVAESIEDDDKTKQKEKIKPGDNNDGTKEVQDHTRNEASSILNSASKEVPVHTTNEASSILNSDLCDSFVNDSENLKVDEGNKEVDESRQESEKIDTVKCGRTFATWTDIASKSEHKNDMLTSSITTSAQIDHDHVTETLISTRNSVATRDVSNFERQYWGEGVYEDPVSMAGVANVWDGSGVYTEWDTEVGREANVKSIVSVTKSVLSVPIESQNGVDEIGMGRPNVNGSLIMENHESKVKTSEKEGSISSVSGNGEAKSQRKRKHKKSNASVKSSSSSSESASSQSLNSINSQNKLDEMDTVSDDLKLSKDTSSAYNSMNEQIVEADAGKVTFDIADDTTNDKTFTEHSTNKENDTETCEQLECLKNLKIDELVKENDTQTGLENGIDNAKSDSVNSITPESDDETSSIVQLESGIKNDPSQDTSSSSNSSLQLLKEAYVETVEDDSEPKHYNNDDSWSDPEFVDARSNDSETEGRINDLDEVDNENISKLVSVTENSKVENNEPPEISIDESKNKNEVESNETAASSPKCNKKSSKKKPGSKHVPFLKVEDKEMYKNHAWNSFPILSETSQKSLLSNDKCFKVENTLINKETITEIECFNILETLNSGGFVDSSVKYLTGKPWKLVNETIERFTSISKSESISEVHRQDKSTYTDDTSPMSFQESLEFLQNAFPAVASNELECVLENCEYNLEWAINLLLDWRFSLHLSEDEKRQFTDGMKKLKLCTSPMLVKPEVDTIDSEPNSLLDMCFNIVEKGHIASREELERQLIETGRDRLERIEGENITKIRRRRSNSLSETSCSSQGRLSSSKSGMSVFRSLSSPGHMGNTSFNVQLTENKAASNGAQENGTEEQVNNQEDYCDVGDSGGQGNDGVFMEEIGWKSKLHNESGDTSVNIEDSVTDMVESGEPLVFNLGADLLKQLEDTFGTIEGRNTDGSGMSVILDHRTAFMLYQSVKRGSVQSNTTTAHTHQQMLEDEELARKLQEQENQQSKVRSRPRVTIDLPSTRSSRRTPLVGLSVLGNIPEKQVMRKTGNQSLADIMKEEQKLQDNEEEINKLLQQDGSQLAVKLRKEKLYQTFPRIDKQYLDNVFQANCLSETIGTIQASLGVDMSDVSEEDLQHEHKLIEATKYQSMQEMLDSYLYQPMVSKDYQDGAEPEYEDYRGEANVHYRLRHECFQKAREAHNRGLKQVASFYSQQGHQHTQKIKEANMRASEQILAERNTDLEKKNILDLHGLHVDEAIAALDRIIPEKEKNRMKQLIIITGRGSHSRGGIARLRPSIIAYLNKLNYNFTETQTGVLKVNLKYRPADR